MSSMSDKGVQEAGGDMTRRLLGATKNIWHYTTTFNQVELHIFR